MAAQIESGVAEPGVAEAGQPRRKRIHSLGLDLPQHVPRATELGPVRVVTGPEHLELGGEDPLARGRDGPGRSLQLCGALRKPEAPAQEVRETQARTGLTDGVPVGGEAVRRRPEQPLRALVVLPLEQTGQVASRPVIPRVGRGSRLESDKSRVTGCCPLSYLSR